MMATASGRASRTRCQRGDRVGAEQPLHAGPVLQGKALQAFGGDVPTAGGGGEGSGMGDEVRQPHPPQPVQGVVGRLLVHCRYGGQFQPVQEGHGRQDPQRPQFPFLSPHSPPPRRRVRGFFPLAAPPPVPLPGGLTGLLPAGPEAASSSSWSSLSRKSCTRR